MTDFISECTAKQRQLLSVDEPGRITISKTIAIEALDHIERLQTRVQELEKQTSPFLFAGNAVLRDALRWHPVSEKPKKDIKCLTPESENVILQIDKGYYPVTAYCSLVSGIWRELKNHEEISVNKRSRWCYIPEDKDGE
jgi:hypothetical protein